MSVVRGLIRRILADPARRRELGVQFIMAMQEHEGRDADRAAAERAYDAVIAERGEPGLLCNLCHQPDRPGGHPECAARARQLPDIDVDACDGMPPCDQCVACRSIAAQDHGDDERRSSQGK